MIVADDDVKVNKNMKGRKTMANERVKKTLKDHGLRQWQLAIILGVSEQTIYRKLRVELPEEEQNKLISLIVRGGVEDAENATD